MRGGAQWERETLISSCSIGKNSPVVVCEKLTSSPLPRSMRLKLSTWEMLVSLLNIYSSSRPFPPLHLPSFNTCYYLAGTLFPPSLSRVTQGTSTPRGGNFWDLLERFKETLGPHSISMLCKSTQMLTLGSKRGLHIKKPLSQVFQFKFSGTVHISFVKDLKPKVFLHPPRRCQVLQTVGL